jgi:hypothetical protein
MPEMQNLDQLPVPIHPVVNHDRSMYQLTDPCPPFHGAPDVGEPSQPFDVIEKGVSESLGGAWEIYPGVIENLRKVRLTRRLRFELGNPLRNHPPGLFERNRAARVGILDATVNRRQRLGVHRDLVGYRHLELQVHHALTVTPSDGHCKQSSIIHINRQ